MTDTTILAPTPIKIQPPPPEYGSRAWYQMIGRKGGQARAAMPCFQAHQSQAGQRSAEINDMAALGRLGARETLRRYGYIFLFQKVRAWRLNHPSAPERQVMALLNKLGSLAHPYEREAMVLGPEIPLAVDFYLPDRNDAIIEVYGRVHYDPCFHHPNHLETRRGLDAHRRKRLEREGFRVLEISHTELTQSEFDVRQRIIEFLLA